MSVGNWDMEGDR